MTNPGEDDADAAGWQDGQGLAWIFYSTQRSGNFDIYARSFSTVEDDVRGDPRYLGPWY